MDDVEKKMKENKEIMDKVIEVVNGTTPSTILSTCFALMHGLSASYEVPEEKGREFLMRQIMQFILFLDKEGKQKESNDN